MKPLLAFLPLFTLGSAPEGEVAPPAGERFAHSGEDLKAIDLDRLQFECDDRVRMARYRVEAEGRESAGAGDRAVQTTPPLIERGPATPGAVPLIRTVDLNVDGCAVMLTGNGEWVALPRDDSETVRFTPAQ